MYLTRMELDMTKRKTMKALISPNMIHGVVESSFSGSRKRNLWRIDQLYGRDYLMILSEEKPQMADAVQQIGKCTSEYPWETCDYTVLLRRITEGSRWHFRLVANPTHSVLEKTKENARGTVYAHITIDNQKKWLIQQSEKHGFSLEPEKFTVVGSKWYHFKKGNEKGKKVTLLSVTYEGLLTVTDVQPFCEMMCKGIGRGKAYGMGLLTIVRERHTNE